MKKICAWLFPYSEHEEDERMNRLLNSKPTVANLAYLKLLDIGLFYTLDDSIMELHLFLSKGRDVELSIDNSVESFSAFADANNKPKFIEGLNCWLSDFKLFMAYHCKPGEHVVLLTGFSIEDSLGLLYDRTFEYPFLARQLNGFESIGQALNKECAKRQSNYYGKNVHVILAEFPQLGEMFREIPDCCPEQRACYENGGGCFFIDEELTDMLKACEDFCHAASVADGEPENKVFPTPGGVG